MNESVCSGVHVLLTFYAAVSAAMSGKHQYISAYGSNASLGEQCKLTLAALSTRPWIRG